MLDILGTVLPAVGVAVATALISIARFLPRRARLLSRVERLGTVFALMPESPQKARVERHLLRALEDLDDWLDPATARQRAWLRVVRWGLVVVSIVGLFAVQLASGRALDMWVGLLVGLAVGTGIALITSAAESLAQRMARRRQEVEVQMREESAAAKRHAAIVRGETPVAD